MVAVFFGVVSCIFFAIVIAKQKKIDEGLKERDRAITEKLNKLMGEDSGNT